MNNTYEVTFTTKDKYRPTTRQIEVECADPYAAVLITSDRFDSLKRVGKTFVPSGRKITIDKVEKVEQEKDEEGENNAS